MTSITIPLLNSTYSRRHLAALFVLFVAYIGAAQVGRLLFSAPAVIQPAAGVALAGLVLGGITLWPAVFAAAVMNAFLGTAPPLVAAAGVVAHTLHAVIGARALRLFGFDPVFRRVRDTLVFIGVALGVSTIVPTIGELGIYGQNLLVGEFTSRATWLSWWSGIIIGDLILAAAIIRYFSKPRFSRQPTEIAELLLAFATLAVTTYLVSWTDAAQATNGVLVILWLLPFIWFALRLGNRFTFLAFLMSTVIILTGVLYGNAPSDQPIATRIITTELFMATLAVIFFLFTAVVEERKRATRELSAQLIRVGSLLEETKRQDRAKSDFIAVFAHELRNPLAPIVSSIELLKLRFGAHPEIAPIVETIEDRARAIVRLLDDLLDVSRISRQTFKLRLEPVDLRTSAEKVVRAMREIADRCGLALRTSLPSFPVMVKADPVRVEQMIGNLLMNAIKYTERGGSIEVVLDAGVDAALTVRDTGAGLSREMLPRVFVPFAGLGVEHRQKSIKEGLGIGLWLAENLAKLHGGTIAAASEGEGKGSAFTIRLPLASDAEQTITTQTHEAMQPITRGSLRVLIVDDNEAAANGLGTLLKHVGNTVELAYVGADVADKVREFQPDVVVLDIGLPDISGYEVARALRAEGFGGKIIALTGYGQDEDKKKAEAAGFDHHLTKPVGLADLQAVLVPHPA